MMIEPTQPQKIKIESWPFRVKAPTDKAAHARVLLLLHGHLGNENAMWILTKPLPNYYHLLAPRAPIKMGEDQFSWHEIGPHWPGIDHYRSLTHDLLTRVNAWIDQENLEIDKIDVMGFSQGAVLAYALALLHPDTIGKIAALAGFIPQSWEQHLKQAALQDREFFIAHGTRDDIVPINKARQAKLWLKEKGARVTFCEADIGHKLSANCFNGLGDFFNR